MNFLNSSETGDWGSRPSSLIDVPGECKVLSAREKYARGVSDCIVIKQNVLSTPTLVWRAALCCVRVKPQPTTISSAFWNP